MNTARTLVMLEPPIRNVIHRMARIEGVSISSKCRDLIREALELEEDIFWDRAAAAREKTGRKKWLSHREVWKH